MGKKIDRFNALIHSRQGRNALTFLVFIGISAVLWVVQVLNEETQRDLRCVVRLTHVPDSLTRVSPLPEAVNVSVRARGTQLMRYLWTSEPEISIDFRTYKSGNHISFGEAALRSFFRNTIGGNVQVQSVTPDTLSVYFTSRPGIELPVKVDAHVMSGPQYAIIGKVRALTDSVMLFAMDGISSKIRSVSTVPIILNNVRSSRTLRVALIPPQGTRVIPDSVDVRVEVEPLVSKTRRVPVKALNVPHGRKLITVPAQIEVYYMVPMSIYKKTDADPHFVVNVDYRDIAANPHTDMLPVTLASAPKDFVNVFLSVDSVEYIVEE